MWVFTVNNINIIPKGSLGYVYFLSEFVLGGGKGKWMQNKVDNSDVFNVK